MGNCYVASEVLYHLLGGLESGMVPIQGEWEGVSHWALRKSNGVVVDVTVEQFKTVPDYSLFRGKGFLTKKPSKKAQELIDLIKGT